MRFLLFCFLSLIIPFAAIAQETEQEDQAAIDISTIPYKEWTIRGWKVRFHGKILDRKIALKDARKALNKHLGQLTKRVPSVALKKLQRVPIWVFYFLKPIHFETTKRVAAYYSFDDKAVVFHDARILGRLGNYDNAVILHELAHGYHHQALGYAYPEIIYAYEEAMKSGKYEREKHRSGKRGVPYAATNAFEYFAELSEAYFSKGVGHFSNDWYPFDRNDLKRHDPIGYKVVHKVWTTDIGGIGQ